MIDRAGDLLEAKGLWIVAFLLSMIVAERLWPAARPLPRAHLDRLSERLRRLGRNLSFGGVNAILSALIVIPLSAWAGGFSLDWRPSWWQGPFGLLGDLVILDAWIYWWHRANHRIPFLWRFHEVHHLDEFLDSTTAIRFHAGEVLLSALARVGVIFLLDVPLASVVSFEVLLAFATIFHHSNLRLPPALEKALSYVIVTPSIHWVHHHAIRGDTDSNYSTVLSVWDRAFASRSPNRREPDMPIGVEGGREAGLGRLFARPFMLRPGD